MSFCRGCGTALHETAPTCPHCGAPQHLPSAEPPGTLWLPVPALIVGILALLAAIGLADSALIDPDEYMGTLLFAGIAIILGAIGTYQQKKGRACLLRDWYWAAWPCSSAWAFKTRAYSAYF